MRLSQRHKEELKAQIAANEERERRQQAEYLLEGKKTRQKLQAEREFIEVSCNSCVFGLNVMSGSHVLYYATILRDETWVAAGHCTAVA